MTRDILGEGWTCRTLTLSPDAEGEVVARFDGVEYHLEPGDVAWAGVGCVHEFRNVGDGVVRWLETQAPQPPSRHSYRFARDWTYLENALAAEAGADD